MANLEQKQAVVSDLVELLKTAQGIYFVDFAKITVKEISEIRKEFKSVSATMRVAKNTLILRALSDIGGLELPDKKLFGQTL